MEVAVVGGKRKRNGHTRAKAPIISLDQPGRLRVAHLLSLLSISHATLYAGLKSGRYPQPDGFDGKMPFWQTATIRAYLARPKTNWCPPQRPLPRTLSQPDRTVVSHVSDPQESGISADIQTDSPSSNIGQQSDAAPCPTPKNSTNDGQAEQ